MILDAKTAIAVSLETALKLKTYMSIINDVSDERFLASDSFRKKFNGYYNVRQQKQIWYDRYYQLMEEQRQKN